MSYLNKTKNIKDLIRKSEDHVCATYGINRRTIYTPSRSPRNALARFAVWFLLYEIHGLSSGDIASYYEFNHSNILHGVKKAKSMRIPIELGYELASGNGGQYVEKAHAEVGKPVDEKVGKTGDKKDVQNTTPSYPHKGRAIKG